MNSAELSSPHIKRASTDGTGGGRVGGASDGTAAGMWSENGGVPGGTAFRAARALRAAAPFEEQRGTDPTEERGFASAAGFGKACGASEGTTAGEWSEGDDTPGGTVFRSAWVSTPVEEQ